jgi:Fe-S cluster assembly protein SufD
MATADRVRADALHALIDARGAGAGGALEAIVERARQAAQALELPSTRDEEWRYTDVSVLARQSFAPPPADPVPVAAGEIAGLLVDEARGARLVFVNGAWSAALSDTGAVPGGVLVANLGTALVARPAEIDAHLARHAAFGADLFSAVNTTLLRDAAVVVVPPGVSVAPPIHLLFLTTRQPAPIATQPRVLLVAGAGSECTLIEDYASLGDPVQFTNSVVEMSVGAGAGVRHVRVQRESAHGYHVGNCAVTQARASRYRSVSLAFGARLSRLGLGVVQSEPDSHSELAGLALIAGRQHADTHSTLDHAAAHGTSRQLHKCIVDGGAHAVFNGRIVIRAGAQRIDSAQHSRSLLLSPKALVNVKPQLEIHADDVKAAHGATVGQLDAEELFYLRSRGLPEALARSLLSHAFAAEVLERIPVPSLVARYERELLARAGL